MPAGIKTPGKHTVQRTRHGLKTAPGPSPLTRLVLDNKGKEEVIIYQSGPGACESQNVWTNKGYMR